MIFNSEMFELMYMKKLATPCTFLLGVEGVKDLAHIVRQGLECRLEKANGSNRHIYTRTKFNVFADENNCVHVYVNHSPNPEMPIFEHQISFV
jgi:hypothetical protein